MKHQIVITVESEKDLADVNISVQSNVTIKDNRLRPHLAAVLDALGVTPVQLADAAEAQRNGK